MKPTRLILIPQSAGEDAPYLVLDPQGRVMDRGVLSVAGTRPAPMRTVAIVPGADVLVRWLDLPAGSPAQQRTAAAWTLADELAASPDRLSVALGGQPLAGEPRLVAVAAVAQIEAWRDYLEALGVSVAVLTPDGLTVPEPSDDRLAAVTFGETVALRGLRFAATVQPDLVEAVAGDRPIEPISERAEVERALIAAALGPPIDLNLREPVATAGTWRRAMATAAVLILSPLALVLAAAGRDSWIADQRRDQAVAAVVRADPALARSPDPIDAFLSRRASAPPPGGAVAAVAALFAALEPMGQAELDILVADPGEGVKVTMSHADYADVQAVSAALSRVGMIATETSTLEDGGRIVSDLTVTAAR